jgi:hypothetical protein
VLGAPSPNFVDLQEAHRPWKHTPNVREPCNRAFDASPSPDKRDSRNVADAEARAKCGRHYGRSATRSFSLGQCQSKRGGLQVLSGIILTDHIRRDNLTGEHWYRLIEAQSHMDVVGPDALMMSIIGWRWRCGCNELSWSTCASSADRCG